MTPEQFELVKRAVVTYIPSTDQGMQYSVVLDGEVKGQIFTEFATRFDTLYQGEAWGSYNNFEQAILSLLHPEYAPSSLLEQLEQAGFNILEVHEDDGPIAVSFSTKHLPDVRINVSLDSDKRFSANSYISANSHIFAIELVFLEYTSPQDLFQGIYRTLEEITVLLDELPSRRFLDCVETEYSQRCMYLQRLSLYSSPGDKSWRWSRVEFTKDFKSLKDLCKSTQDSLGHISDDLNRAARSLTTLEDIDED